MNFHPGTRGYIYEWIYHQLMKQEDIIALRYKFINVTIIKLISIIYNGLNMHHLLITHKVNYMLIANSFILHNH